MSLRKKKGIVSIELVLDSSQTAETSQAIEGIKKSGYGADVKYENIEGRYYVSVPCDSDMF